MSSITAREYKGTGSDEKATTSSRFHVTQFPIWDINTGHTSSFGTQDPLSEVTSQRKETSFLPDNAYATFANTSHVGLPTTSGQNVSSDLALLLHFNLLDYTIVSTLLIIGLFGNVMTIAVMRRTSAFETKPTAMILSLLSVADSSVLLMVPWNKISFQQLIGFDVRGLHWIGCKVFFWAWPSAKTTSSWFIVLISLERCIAIACPLRARNLITKRNTSYAISLVCTVIFIYNGTRSVFSNVTKNGICLDNIPDHPENAVLVHNFVVGGAILSTYIPAILVFFLNLTSVYKLMRQSRENELLTSSQSRQTSCQQKTNRQLSAMLLSVAIAFQILVTPMAVLHIIATLNDIPLFHTNEFKLVIAREIAMILEQLNYSINFYLYTLCSRTFADQFLAIVHCERRTSERQPSGLYTLKDRTSSTSISVYD